MKKVSVNKNDKCRFSDGTFVPVGAIYGKLMISGVACYYYIPNFPHAEGIFVQGGSCCRFTKITKGKLYDYIIGKVEEQKLKHPRLKEEIEFFEGRITLTDDEKRIACPDGVRRIHRKSGSNRIVLWS